MYRASNVILVTCLIIIDNAYMAAFCNQACKAYDDDELDNFYSAYCENYTSRALYKDCTKDIPNRYVFKYRLNESSVGISLMLSGRLFQAGYPATQKAQSPNLVQDDDDRLGTASLTPDVGADRCVDDLSLVTSGKKRSTM